MQNQTVDLTTDDNLLEEQTGPSGSDLAREFTHPGYSFKGEQLRPYTAGTDLLFTQVLDRNDSPLTLFLSFIFVHRAKWNKAERPALLALCWDKNAFRTALLDWVESLGQLSDKDKDDAGNIFGGMREAARKTVVDVIPDGTEKKTKASHRRK